MSIYSPLCDYLKNSGKPTVTLTFSNIAKIIGNNLPAYASQKPWWSNHDSHSQAKSGWLAAGYQVINVDLTNQKATFIKTANVPMQSTSPKSNSAVKSKCVTKKNVSNTDDSNRSKQSLAREKKRNSPEMQDFRKEIELFLEKTKADADTIYRLKTDLAKKTDMPFYKEDHGSRCGRAKMSAPEIVYIYCELLISYGDMDFSERLLDWLSRQQEQSMRKLSQKLNESENQTDGIWEHSIPVNYTKKMLLDLIKKKDLKTIKEYLKFVYEKAPQICLTKEQDDKVNKKYRDTMPEGWDWKTGDPFIRYKKAGIFEELDL